MPIHWPLDTWKVKGKRQKVKGRASHSLTTGHSSASTHHSPLATPHPPPRTTRRGGHGKVTTLSVDRRGLPRLARLCHNPKGPFRNGQGTRTGGWMWELPRRCRLSGRSEP